ncbi:alpha/beta hydrolase family esterase [Shimia abyssi]|uniref:Polyhydroxybutyrate depolymerase n=1 Tax=Shimia abyssi TaxID=1662395 RepID=A0A2P8FBI4_9RHOB|nr:PHB depolymerase family esterase [Shimia abyssi]PSL19064.1 polyhydroxybutyrate depolymerase [Shimia abyssi]
MLRSSLSALTALLIGTSAPASACSTTTPCNVAEGEYFIALPDISVEGNWPAVMFIHGFGASGPSVFRNTGMVNRFLDKGYAVIAPQGLPRSNGRGRSWSVHPWFPRERDEIQFLKSVRDDAVDQHGIDANAIMLAGFSIGGSMTAYVACSAPDAFTAYGPIGGNFWRPHPTECAGPVKMLHTHGWTDGTVPLEGRVLRGGDITNPDALAQGDVFHALDIWRQTNECVHLKADSFVTDGPFWRRKWERCHDDSALEFALFPGGHRIPNGWVEMALDWFENL